jgi:hypothetical protein
MNVLEVISKAAKITGANPDDEHLLTAYNLVEQELAGYFFPLATIDKVFGVDDDKIYYNSLHNQAIVIKEISDAKGGSVKFRDLPEYIKISKNYDGKIFYVRYYRMPRLKVIEDASEYNARYHDLMVLGVCAEYWLISGMYEQAKRYSDAYMTAIKKFKII